MRAGFIGLEYLNLCASVFNTGLVFEFSVDLKFTFRI